jgi:hypothetical protein
MQQASGASAPDAVLAGALAGAKSGPEQQLLHTGDAPLHSAPDVSMPIAGISKVVSVVPTHLVLLHATRTTKSAHWLQGSQRECRRQTASTWRTSSQWPCSAHS